MQMQLPPTIDQLIFKGTHNSYQCIGECNDLGICDLDPPYMGHPPSAQIDDFGVWAVELDFSATMVNGVPRAVVGHDRAHHGTCWFYFLREFLTDIRNAKALKYRPVFIYFDIHDWDEGEIAGYSHEDKLRLAIDDVDRVFQGNYILLAKYVQDNSRYPSLQDIVGTAVIYFPQQQFLPDSSPPFRGTLRGTWADHCTNPTAVEKSIRTGDPADDTGGPCGSEGCRVLRLDQYQSDWTFGYAVPPNPLVVDVTASPPWTVTHSDGDYWQCDTHPGIDVSIGQVVHEHGTYVYPYKTLGAAITRAEGTILETSIQRDSFRAGYGWTVLLKPGQYHEPITIAIPLTLAKDDRFPGTVQIG
jgi:hypothetical protein